MKCRWNTWPAVVVCASLALVSAWPAVAIATDLFTPANSLTQDSHYVSTSVFVWYNRTAGQLSGPWQPVEGRSNWTGEPDWWQTQVKQMMAANIDVLNVHLFPGWGGWSNVRMNLFQALHDLRAQGYNVPKVAPFLDTAITTSLGWTPGTGGQPVNLATTAGKDAFVDQYIQFYEQYYSQNTDPHADSYISQIDGRVVLNNWHLNSSVTTNVSSMTRADIQSRLASELGPDHELFANLPSNGIFQMGIASGEHFSFEDERVVQFENASSYYKPTTAHGRTTAQVMAGYWDENIRNPGTFLPRDGGTHYKDAWNSVQAAKNSGLKHVYLESWNEYDEGSGIYAADPGPPYIQPDSGNTHTDTWSSTSDPYEYIKTTAEGARLFNDTPDRDARILWHDFPTQMNPGEVRHATITVRNEGDISWTGAAQYKFGQQEFRLGETLFGAGRFPIDDTQNEIPTYGGIFRGRPITFDVQLVAPTAPGSYQTHWGMLQEGVTWFGQELDWSFNVVPKTVSTLTDNLLGYYQFEADGSDSSGNGRDTTLMGTAAISAGGLFGNALDLTENTSGNTGGSGAMGWATRPHDAAFDFGTGDFTVQAWLNVDAADPLGEMVMVEQFSDGNGPGWTFYWRTQNGVNVLLFDTSVNADQQGAASIGSGWHQLLVRRSGAGADNLTLYYDGAQLGSASSSANITTSGDFYIGRRNPGQGTGFAVDGLMDEVALWNRALSDQEIGDLYNNGQGLLIIGSTNVPGDYNDDGTVDAADYTVWRDNLGAAAGTLPNDPLGSAIGQAQYDQWKASFGASLGAASAAAAVPEPATTAFLIAGIVCLAGQRWRRWQ